MSTVGIDEAGRGCVIGPLVVAGVLVNEKETQELVAIGVKDSKLLSPHAREQKYSQIKTIAERVVMVFLSPAEIDQVVFAGVKFKRLNWLEAKTAAKIITILNPQTVYIDSPDVFEARHKQQILDHLSFKPNIVSEHYADKNYPVVSAASIVAKVERDKAIAKLKMKYGDFGSGYPSDPKTIRFLKGYAVRNEPLPFIVRHSWKTVRTQKNYLCLNAGRTY